MDELAELLGESPAMQMVRDKLHRLLDRQRAGHRLPPVLLQGDTGTGKGLVARVLHRYSARSGAPFVDVNCAAIPETLLEAELFGFERGAFTDARNAKPGLFQAAHGGVLFLDEVGLLAEPMQAKLLTAIEDRAVRRLGSTRAEPADVWLISATNADLQAAVSARHFRSDLYHRLAVLTVDLPPLRDRGHDVLLLARRFLDRACAEYGLSPKRLDPQAEASLIGYSWPGNIRELANVIERAALFSDTPVVTADALGPFHSDATVSPPLPPAGIAMSRDEAMRQHLLTALEQTEWNISHTAARLGVARNTVYARMEKFGLRPGPAPKESPSPSPPAPPTPARSALAAGLDWEWRSLTLLRADLDSAETVDSWSKTSRALDEVIAKVQSFGGRLEEVTPTGVVAAFGVEPTEDAARRAAHAAMAIQRGVQRGRERAATLIGVTIGLHVAPLLLSRVGTRVEVDAAAMRTAWPILEELLRVAAPGETVASGAAVPFLERRFDLVRVDGTADAPEGVYRLTGQERGGLGLWGAMTRFVGRRDELEVLGRRLALAESGHGQVAAVVGEAGVGKSRLIHELAHAHRARGWRVLEGMSVSFGQSTSYLPVVGLLKQYFSIQDRDDLREIREKITGKVLALDASLQSTLPAFETLLDVPVDDAAWQILDPTQRRQRILEAVKRLLLREAREQPLLLIFEDLHWSDGETRALLDTLVDGLGSARVLLLVSYRPEHQHAWGSKTYCSLLRLDTLPAESAGEFLQALLGDDPGLTPLTHLLVKRGNPFFLEETVRTLVETSALTGERGRYRLVQPVHTLEVPPTVQAMLAARIDRLSPEAKRLLQMASVVGRDVPFALLRTIAEQPDEALRRELDVLKSAEFLYVNRLEPDLEYAFKHALTHEVTYGGLPHARRCELHARIVGAIETLYRDRLGEHTERLAHHAFRGEMWEKAFDYLRRAGNRAAARSAYNEAIVLLEQALLALGHVAESHETIEHAIDIRFELRTAFQGIGKFVENIDLLRKAEALASALDDQSRLGRVSCYSSVSLFLTGDYDEAIASARRALAIAERLGDSSIRIVALQYLGMIYQMLGDFRPSGELLSKSLNALRGDLRSQTLGQTALPSVQCRAWLGHGMAEQGKFAEGVAMVEEGLRIAEELAQPYSLALACFGVGVVHLLYGNYLKAIGPLERGLGFCEDLSFLNWLPRIATCLGTAYARSQRIDDALPLLEQAVEVSASTRTAWPHSLSLINLGAAWLLAERLADADRVARQAFDQARRRKERGLEAWSLRLLGEIASRYDSRAVDEATEHYRRSGALAEQLGMRPLVAHCHLGLGKLYRRTGKRQEAGEHLTTATAMYRDMDMHFWLEQAEAETD
jgi:transcriptional regulator with AAA-type ATPase domain/tetratricopeptide (TPR) repeat protein